MTYIFIAILSMLIASFVIFQVFKLIDSDLKSSKDLENNAKWFLAGLSVLYGAIWPMAITITILAAIIYGIALVLVKIIERFL